MHPSLRIPTEPAATTKPEPHRAGNGSGTLSAQVMPDGSITTRRQTYMSSANAGAVNADPSGVFDRVFDPKATGYSISIHDMKSDSIVRPRGFDGELPLSAALDMGLVHQATDGTWRSGPAPKGHQRPLQPQEATADDLQSHEQEERQEEQEEELHPDLQTEALGDETIEATLTEYVTKTDGGSQLAIVEEIAAGSEELSAEAINTLASEAGIEPEVMAGKITEVRAAFETQAMSTIQAVVGDGIDPQDVVNAAYEADPKAFASAIKDHATKRSTAGYTAIANSYIEGLADTNPDLILGAELGEGLDVGRGPDGQVIVTTPDGTMTWRSAVRAGYIKLSGRTGK